MRFRMKSEFGRTNLIFALDLDPEEEAMKPGANEVLWAVVAAYTK